jgi:hypothetical protein
LLLVRLEEVALVLKTLALAVVVQAVLELHPVLLLLQLPLLLSQLEVAALGVVKVQKALVVLTLFFPP